MVLSFLTPPPSSLLTLDEIREQLHEVRKSLNRLDRTQSRTISEEIAADPLPSPPTTEAIVTDPLPSSLSPPTPPLLATPQPAPPMLISSPTAALPATPPKPPLLAIPLPEIPQHLKPTTPKHQPAHLESKSTPLQQLFVRVTAPTTSPSAFPQLTIAYNFILVSLPIHERPMLITPLFDNILAMFEVPYYATGEASVMILFLPPPPPKPPD